MIVGSRRIRPRRGCAFTIPELLIVIGIMVALVSLLLPAVGRVRDQAIQLHCESNMRQIGYGVQSYLAQNDGHYGPYKNWGRWQAVWPPVDGPNGGTVINPKDSLAYWGVAYALAGGLRKEVFNCPAATDTSDDGGNARDGPFAKGYMYICYGVNGYGAADSGFSDAQRKAVFGMPNQSALFYRDSNGSWFGRRSNQVKHSSQTMLAMDSFEQCLDGNGDTFDNWSQWVGKEYHFLRHNNRANLVFADAHVETLTRTELQNAGLYTGQ